MNPLYALMNGWVNPTFNQPAQPGMPFQGITGGVQGQNQMPQNWTNPVLRQDAPPQQPGTSLPQPPNSFAPMDKPVLGASPAQVGTPIAAPQPRNFTMPTGNMAFGRGRF